MRVRSFVRRGQLPPHDHDSCFPRLGAGCAARRRARLTRRARRRARLLWAVPMDCRSRAIAIFASSALELRERHAGRAPVQARHDVDRVVHERRQLRFRGVTAEEAGDVVLGGGKRQAASFSEAGVPHQRLCPCARYTVDDARRAVRHRRLTAVRRRRGAARGHEGALPYRRRPSPWCPSTIFSSALEILPT